MAKPPEDTILEERKEFMVSPTGGNPTRRIAHFLKPSITSIKGPVFELPPLSLSSPSPSPSPNFGPTKCPLKVAFHGWRLPTDHWKKWVEHMHSLHKTTWIKAGIHDAILNSTYETRRNDDVIFGVAEKWCSETKTFVFQWGEATITLEDMMVLGGYSVLGDSVFSKPIEIEEMAETHEKLIEARLEVTRTRAQKACQHTWKRKFMKTGSEIEHEAFLAFWLSRFVFPTSPFNTIAKHVFTVAVHLARGTKLALAPVVLASIYRDLRLLKESIDVSYKFRTKGYDGGDLSHLTLTIWAPLNLVQIWIWERFPKLQPKPNSIEHGKPRLARWDKVKKLNIEDLRLVIDSSGEDFRWRPYYLFHNLCNEREKWVSVDPCLDVELESFARCLRVCELVGLDCIEQYFPHRVAMQFGMDQDLPGRVGSPNTNPEVAWDNYNRPIRDEKIYVPPRLFESDVTTRYLEWWKRSKSAQKDGMNCGVKEEKETSSSERLKRKLPTSTWKIADDDSLQVPPGFPPKSNRVETRDSDDEDGLTLNEILRKVRTNDGNIQIENQLKSGVSTTSHYGSNQESESVEKSVDVIELSDTDGEADANENGKAAFVQVENVVKVETVTDLSDANVEEANESGEGTFIPVEMIVEREIGTELWETNAEDENGSGKETSARVEKIVESEPSEEFSETNAENENRDGAENFIRVEKIVKSEPVTELPETYTEDVNESGKGTFIPVEEIVKSEPVTKLPETYAEDENRNAAENFIWVEKIVKSEPVTELRETYTEDENESERGTFMPVEKIVKSEPVTKFPETYTEDVNGNGTRTPACSIVSNDDNRGTPGLELEARIERLEKLVAPFLARLKSAKFLRRLA